MNRIYFIYLFRKEKQFIFSLLLLLLCDSWRTEKIGHVACLRDIHYNL